MFKPVYVSASQIDSYRSCPRRWWFKSIRKIPTDTTPALVFGDRFAKAVEARLKGLQIPRFDAVADAVIDRFLDAAASFYPAPNPLIYAERKVQFDLAPETRMVGYLDVLDLSTGEIQIRDHKTRADKRYAPTAEKLRSDLQLSIYAHAILLEYPDAPEVSVGHINYVKPPKEYANDLKWIEHEWTPAVFLRHTPLDRATVATTMAGVMEDAAAMTTLADPLLEPTSVPFDTTGRACFAYNQPCPFAGICPKVSMLKTSPPNPNSATPPPPAPRPPSAVAPPAPPTAPRPAPVPAPAAQRSPTAPPPPAPRPNVTLGPPPAPARVEAPVIVPSRPLPPAPYTDDLFDPPINPNQAQVAAQPVVARIPVANIPGIKPAVLKSLQSMGFVDSLEVAHATVSWLRSAGVTGARVNEIEALAGQMRALHGVTAPRPFDFCPLLDGIEPEASPADLAAALPSHPDTPPLAAQPVALSAPSAPAPPVAAPAATQAAGFTLYLDCCPVKGAPFVTLEDWLDPVFRAIEAQCGVDNWRSVLEFGKASELFHAAVRNSLEGRSDLRVPGHLVVLSAYSDYAKATLDLLVRYATVVVRR